MTFLYIYTNQLPIMTFQLSPKTIQQIKITFHVTFIAIIIFELFREAFSSIPNDWLFFLTSDALENFICATFVYLLYYYVWPIKAIWKKVSYSILFISILFGLALLKDYRIHNAMEFDQSFEYFTSFLGQTLLFYLAIYVMNRLDLLNRYKTMETELHQAKEQLLRNQLHPHFLFNAFNSLYSLSLKHDPETPEYILKLSSMMRYLTDDTHHETVPLQKEIDFIKQYLSIETIRFGEDARITFTIDNTIKTETFIAPFLLITLVENAFKHGFYTNSKDAFVTINLAQENNDLIFTVENSILKKQHFQTQTRNGIGLKNLQQRLQLLYPKRSHLQIQNNENLFKTQLNITLN